MRTSKEYLEKLAAMRKNVYLDGTTVGRDDPRIITASTAIRSTFDLVDDPNFKGLNAVSHITGKRINRFCNINQNMEDLMAKQKVIRDLSARAAGCIQRCMGIDALNGISVSSKNCDIKYGTNYYERFLKYMEWFQENDLVAACAQSDPKGDRLLRPAQQPDPDQYLHVVERREDGVVVRGAKLHNTMAPYSDEIIVVPTRALGKNEKDYAIAFALPADTEGIHLIGRAGGYPERAPGMEAPIAEIGDVESFTVFDNVFVPNERIFINGETEFGGEVALLFALYHRHSYCGCKPGVGDMMMGSTALMADYLGIEKMGHVKEKLAELISVAELVFGAGIAAAVKSYQAPSGTQIPDIIYCNVGRRHAGHNIYNEYNILCDIAGGISATVPYSQEYNNPEITEFIKKYCARRQGVSPENHYKAALLVSDILTSDVSSELAVAGVHGGGSPIMEDIAILGAYNLKKKKELAKYLAGIKED